MCSFENMVKPTEYLKTQQYNMVKPTEYLKT